ncbi:choice-of-anchor J domain-containing protein [Flavobacterium sp.]|uniref:choice-of-anchor J domain-containing protein n=1 Tax=Flavobacterium sp. TaxID=239 RepID=UPI0038FD3AB6
MKLINKIIFSIVCFCVTNAAFSQVLNEGFEGTTFPPTTSGNWTVLDNGVGTIMSWTETTDPTRVHSGLKAAIVDRENVGAGNTSIDWLISPQITVGANSQLRFFTRQSFTGNSGSTYEIRISTNATQNNQAAYLPVQSWTETTLNATFNVYEEKIVNLADYPAGTQLYIAFVKLNTQPTGTISGDRWLIDDVKVVQQCLDPTILNVGTITPTTVSLNWTNNGSATSWEVEVIPAASTPTGVGIAVPTNPFVVTGLMPATAYKYYVRANCGSGNFSQWVGPFNFFTTPAGSICSTPITISSLPYNHSTSTNVYGDEVDTPQGTGCEGGTTNYLEGAEVFYSYTASVSETIKITMNPYSGNNNSSIFVYNGCSNVGVSCLAGVANISDTSREITLPVISGQTYIIVVSSSTTPTTGILYDLIIERANCLHPINFSTTNVTNTSADISWATASGANSWQVEMVQVTAYNGSYIPLNPITINTNNYSATGLNLGTYRLWVRENCGNGNFSAWSYNTFSTFCPVPTIVSSSYNGVSANITWTSQNLNSYPAQNNWEIFIRPLGEAGQFTGIPVNTSTYIATNLEPDIVYECYARSNCGVNGYSNWNNARVIIGGISLDQCIKTNTIEVNTRVSLFVNLINHLLGIVNSGGSVPNGYNPTVLQNLAQYIADPNPAIYNFSYLNGTLEFSFSDHPNALRKDVKITGYSPSFGLMTNFVSTGYYSSQYFMYKVPASFGSNLAELTLKHLNLCEISCVPIIGEITFIDFPEGSNYTCGNRRVHFSPQANDIDIENIGATFQWTFKDQNGYALSTATDLYTEYTFTTVGNNKAELVITEPNGCTTTFTKIVPVVACDPCTATNPRTPRAKQLFIALLNHLRTKVINNEDIPITGYTCPELKAFELYITDEKQKIYGFTVSGNTMAFWFHPVDQNAGSPDVYLSNWNSTMAPFSDIDVVNYTQSNLETNIDNKIILADGSRIALGHTRHINFCPDDFCVNHVAIVVDESGSIDNSEKINIKRQLKAFLNQQAYLNDLDPNWNMYVSLIGMSDTDINNRTDHVLYKRVSGTITDPNSTLTELMKWVDGPALDGVNSYGFRNGTTGISGGSDFWKSGLDKATSNFSAVPPKLVVMITDGSETNDLTGLKATMAKFNNYQHILPLNEAKPHLYVVGIDNGFYVYDEQSALGNKARNEDPNYVPNLRSSSPTSRVTPALALSLKYLLQIPSPDFPINTINTSNHASSDPDFKNDDFIGMANMDIFGDPESTFLSDNMDDVYAKCGSTAIKDPCDDCFSFQPEPGKVGGYVLSAWVKEELNVQVKNYTSPKIILRFLDYNRKPINPLPITNSEIFFIPKGDIIEGWQRIGGKFEIPANTIFMEFELVNESNSIPVFFDDIRIYPVKGNMKSFVYDPETFRLMSELDENNYATYYEYDNEGGLVRIKKETVKGIKTIQETRSGNVIKVE